MYLSHVWTLYLAHGIKPAFVGGELSLEGLVLLELGLEVGWVSVALVLRHLQLLVDPGVHLQ